MLTVNLVCVGKIKEKYIKDGIDEFSKRLKAFAKFSIIELKEFGNDDNIEASILKEAELIKGKILEKSAYNILLDIDGKNFSSTDMAEKIEEKMITGISTINFVIGGSYGVSNEIKSLADERLSFSKLTFPHQLMRLIFTEQLYRWFSIINNNKYHK